MISRAALLTSPRVRKLGVPPNLIIVLPSELASSTHCVDAEAVSSGETPLDLSTKALFAQIRSVVGFALKPADRLARRS